MSSNGNDGIPYIGSRISLISRKNIRYEGILYNIDTKESSVALKTVRSFGTEDRLGENGLKVPSSESVYEYVIFRGADIKDLHVCEAAPTQPSLSDAPDHTNLENNTSNETVSITSSSSLSSSKTRTTTRTTLSNNLREEKKKDSPKLNDEKNIKKTDESTQNDENRRVVNNRTIPGMGGHLLKRRERGVHDDKVPDGGNGEFDFSEGLEGFDKVKEYSKLNINESETPSISKQAYQKSSFFDSISCDALDRLEGKTGRLTSKEERVLNTETFGAIGLSINRRYNHRGRGRGRGRGGRGNGGRGNGGRGRGHGRGGHRVGRGRGGYSYARKENNISST